MSLALVRAKELQSVALQKTICERNSVTHSFLPASTTVLRSHEIPDSTTSFELF